MATLPAKPVANDLEKLEEMLPKLQENLVSLTDEMKSVSDTQFIGYSKDKTVSICVLGTGMIENPEKDIQFGKSAVSNGLTSFKCSVGEALQNAIEKAHQSMTSKLDVIRSNMQIPEEFLQLMKDDSEHKGAS